MTASGATCKRLEVDELPHLLGSYLGCGELLLEGFQSALDPARLDATGHLAQGIGAAMTCRKRRELSLETLYV